MFADLHDQWKYEAEQKANRLALVVGVAAFVSGLVIGFIVASLF